jgi:6-phosphogluconate dehydrogenase
MQLGIIGLGRMGGNIARRLMLNGHTTVVYDRNTAFVDALSEEGATGLPICRPWSLAWPNHEQSGSCCRQARRPKTPSTP